MAVKINTALTINGSVLPTGAIVIPVVQFLPVVLNENGGEWDGTKTRAIFVKLPVWGSKLLFQQLHNPFITVDDFDNSFQHNLTDMEYDAYTPAELDQMTLDFIELSVGEGMCEIIDPYI